MNTNPHPILTAQSETNPGKPLSFSKNLYWESRCPLRLGCFIPSMHFQNYHRWDFLIHFTKIRSFDRNLGKIAGFIQ